MNFKSTQYLYKSYEVENVDYIIENVVSIAILITKNPRYSTTPIILYDGITDEIHFRAKCRRINNMGNFFIFPSNVPPILKSRKNGCFMNFFLYFNNKYSIYTTLHIMFFSISFHIYLSRQVVL